MMHIKIKLSAFDSDPLVFILHCA